MRRHWISGRPGKAHHLNLCSNDCQFKKGITCVEGLRYRALAIQGTFAHTTLRTAHMSDHSTEQFWQYSLLSSTQSS